MKSQVIDTALCGVKAFFKTSNIAGMVYMERNKALKLTLLFYNYYCFSPFKIIVWTLACIRIFLLWVKYFDTFRKIGNAPFVHDYN